MRYLLAAAAALVVASPASAAFYEFDAVFDPAMLRARELNAVTLGAPIRLDVGDSFRLNVRFSGGSFGLSDDRSLWTGLLAQAGASYANYAVRAELTFFESSDNLRGAVLPRQENSYVHLGGNFASDSYRQDGQPITLGTITQTVEVQESLPYLRPDTTDGSTEPALEGGRVYDRAFFYWDGARPGDAEQPFLPVAGDDPSDGFDFDFDAPEGEMVFIDPDYAVGYDYRVASGPNILTALFPTVAGDLDGYNVFDLDGNLLASNWLAGDIFDFRNYGFDDGVTGFGLRGIDFAAALDPNDATAFVTGLTFASGGRVQMSQTAIAAAAPGAVPEPATWATMMLGFGLVGLAARRRRRPAHG